MNLVKLVNLVDILKSVILSVRKSLTANILVPRHVWTCLRCIEWKCQSPTRKLLVNHFRASWSWQLCCFFTFHHTTVPVAATRPRSTSNAHRPEIIFTYDSAQTTSTKLTVNEPCGFLLPSVLKRLQEFFDVASDSDLLSANPEPSSYGMSQVFWVCTHSLTF